MIVPRPLAALLVTAALTGCGGDQGDRSRPRWTTFECGGRKASYFVVGSLAADEAGVTLDCATGPRVTRWTQDNGGARAEDSRALSPDEFDEVWVAIEATGWRNLDDCPPDDGPDVPVYSFEVMKGKARGAFQCDALRPPFPWSSLVDELDQLAARISGDEGKNTFDLDDRELQ